MRRALLAQALEAEVARHSMRMKSATMAGELAGARDHIRCAIIRFAHTSAICRKNCGNASLEDTSAVTLAPRGLPFREA